MPQVSFRAFLAAIFLPQSKMASLAVHNNLMVRRGIVDEPQEMDPGSGEQVPASQSVASWPILVARSFLNVMACFQILGR